MHHATHLFSLVALIALGGLLASPALAQDNLIAYGDFESFSTGEVAAANVFTGYTEDDGASTTYAIVDTEAVSGSQSLSVAYGGGAANFYQVQNFQPVTVTPGAEYTFSFQAKTDAADGSASVAYAVNVDQFGDNLGVAYEQPVTTEWQSYEITFTAPEGVTTVSGILQFGYANNTDGAVYVDDLSIVASEPPPPNLIAYGDFESFSTGEVAAANVFTGYTEDDGASTTYAIVDTEAVSGSQSLSVAYGGGAANFYQVQNFQPVTVTPGAEYTFSFQAKTDAADGSASVAYAVNVDQFGDNLGVAYEQPVTTEWQSYEITFTAPEGVTTVSGILQFGYANNTDGAVYVDDLSVVLIAEPEPIEPGEDGAYQASLSGANEVDPVDTPATGSAIVTVDGTTVTVEGSFSGLSSTYAASHIHRGAAGENGPVEITLAAVVTDGTSGVWNAAENTFTVSQTLADSIKSGLAYVNVHSADNPGGEIRGQIVSTDGNGSLIVTGVFDGPLSGGIPKVVELYVLEDIEDLSRYAFGSANNGGGSDGAEFVFPEGSASAGDFIAIATEVDGFTSYFGEAPDYTSDAAAINGDDAIEVFFDADDNGDFAGGEVVDVFGDINVDGSGEAWDYLDGWAYRMDATGPDGSTFVLGSWTFSGIDANDDQTSNATATAPFPYQTYVAAVPMARLQVIHNAPDPAAASVDVYVNGELMTALDDLDFRTATPFIDAPAGVELTIDVVPADAADNTSPVFSGTYTLEDGMTYQIIASGVLDATPGDDSDDTDDEFTLVVAGDAQESAAMANMVDVRVVHGSPDAPAVDVFANSALFVEDLAYPNVTDYLSVAPDVYVLAVAPANETPAVGTFTADLSGAAGGAVTVLASGFLTPGQDEPALTLLAVFPDGTASVLPVAVSNEGDAESVLSLAVANPVRQDATVRFSLPAPGEATVTLYDALGRLVATLVDGEIGTGIQTARLDAASLASGVYVLRLQAGDEMVTRTLTVVR